MLGSLSGVEWLHGLPASSVRIAMSGCEQAFIRKEYAEGIEIKIIITHTQGTMVILCLVISKIAGSVVPEI